MNLTELERHAKALMLAHGVGSLGFEFSNTKRAIATCHGVWVGSTALATKIAFSRHWGAVLDEEDCRNVMLHEIAHALTMGHDHDWVFAAKCRELGTPASRHCYTPKADIDYLWVGTCPKGHKVRMHRAPQLIRSCSDCFPAFRFEHVFKWTKAGSPVAVKDMPAKYQKNYYWHAERASVANLSRNS